MKLPFRSSRLRTPPYSGGSQQVCPHAFRRGRYAFEQSLDQPKPRRR